MGEPIEVWPGQMRKGESEKSPDWVVTLFSNPKAIAAKLAGRQPKFARE